jgi:hypothetical protein
LQIALENPMDKVEVADRHPLPGEAVETGELNVDSLVKSHFLASESIPSEATFNIQLFIWCLY